MSFLTPFWWMVAALGLPVIIHLLSRRPPQDHVFPATVFLIQAKSEKFSVSKLKNFLLLLLRTLIIFLLLMALWRPHIKTSAFNTGGARKGSFVLIVDNSLGMGYGKKGEPSILDSAKARGTEVLESFHETSRKCVISTSHPNQGSMTYSHNVAQANLQNISLSPGDRSLNLAISKARRLLEAEKGATREIYIFTDFDQTAFENVSRETLKRIGDSHIRLFFFDLGQKERPEPNAHFVKVKPQPATVPPNTVVTIPFVLDGVDREQTVVFNIEGKKRGQTVIKASDKKGTKGEFSHRFVREGIYRASLALTAPDSLEEDNTYHFAIQVLPPRKILLTHPMLTRKYSSLFYLQLALDPSRGKGIKRFDLEVAQFNRLAAKKLSDCDALIVLGVGSLSRSMEKKLKAFVEKGGALLFFPPLKTSRPGELLPSNLDEIQRPAQPLHWVPTDYDRYEILAPFQEGENGDLQAPQFFKIALPKKLTPAWQRVLNYNNGRPALLYRALGEGMIFVFTSSPDLGETNKGIEKESLRWSTLPAEPVFPILLHEIIKKIYQHRTLSPLEVGETLRVFLGREVKNPKVITPDFKSTEGIFRKGTLGFYDTSQRGVYKIVEKGKELLGVGVNSASQESKFNYITKGEFQERYSLPEGSRIRNLEEIAAQVDTAAVFRDITGWLLILLTIFMITESFLSNVEGFGEKWMKKLTRRG